MIRAARASLLLLSSLLSSLLLPVAAVAGPGPEPTRGPRPRPRPARGDEDLAGQKKLIEFGWDEPDTRFLRHHIAELERTPFDGCVFHLDYDRPDGGRESFTWKCWGRRAFEKKELWPAVADLEAVATSRFRHNFLRFNTTPADLDWFDDHSAVLQNARLAARIAREGGCAGLLFDIEQYNAPLFDYRRQRDAKTKSWKEYAAEVRRRGREVIDAFQEGFPGATIFLTFGYSLPWVQSGKGKRPLAECSYGLLAPFLDGLVEGARGETNIVDGHELAYGYREPSEFPAAYRLMKKGAARLAADPAKYARVFSFSFGIWLDAEWRKRGWHTDDLTRNVHTPESFEALARAALQRADEYVWIYSETPRWWSPKGEPVKLPPAYAAALRRALASARGEAEKEKATEKAKAREKGKPESR